MAEQYPALHAYTHLPEGSDPLAIPGSPLWNDISSSVTVTRVSGGDSNPDIDVVLAQEIVVGGETVGSALILALAVVQLRIDIASGGPGSGTSPYLINLPIAGFNAAAVIAGTGLFYPSGGATVNRCSIRSLAGLTAYPVIWDGAGFASPLGPKASSGGGPFDFAVGDTIYDGQIILQT